jgi:NTP pyrophosphatase (non-canonical NTP hydrolase)
MNLDEYQTRAVTTDLHPGQEGMVISLLGLAGEVGELLTEYKKHLRDGEAHHLFNERIAEELGDLLWYVASVAHKFGLNLAEVADRNLVKNQSRWNVRIGQAVPIPLYYDEEYPEIERLPRHFKAAVNSVSGQAQLIINGKPLGDPLTDNAYDEDGYRYHDVFHLAFAAVLGWSPVIRKLLDVKRKSNKQIDQVEDGGSATAIEEGIAALIFSHAKSYNFFEGVREVDTLLLQTVKNLTAHLEVNNRSLGEWEQAILAGFTVWRAVNTCQSGDIWVSLPERTITFHRSDGYVSALLPSQ